MTHITRGYSVRSQRALCGLSHNEIGAGNSRYIRLLTRDEARARAIAAGNRWQAPGVCTVCMNELARGA